VTRAAAVHGVAALVLNTLEIRIRKSMMGDRTCIYIAARLPEANRIEEVLTRLGIDYAVEIAPYATRLLGLFPTQYRGAHFYVMVGQAGYCQQALHRAGLTKGLVKED
jgi:hypothetical protein